MRNPIRGLVVGVVARLNFRGQVSHDKWYIAIHAGPTLKSKGGAKLVACGNVS